MKKQSRCARSSSSLPVRHQLEHVVPTVIHDPEEEMTALGRLTTHAIKEPKRYLAWPVTIIACVFIGVLVWKLATGGRSSTSEVWAKLETAKTAEDRVNLAKEYPKTPAATWALLQAATEYYNLALSDLPNNRDVALPTAKKALDLFDQIVHEAPHDSPQARAAALGKARVLEMRNELAKALDQYQLVITDWPGTPEAEDAKRFAEALKDPQAAAFYKELYAYSPTKMTLPPFGTETLPSTFPGPLNPSDMPATSSAPFGPLTPTANPSSTTTSPTTGTGLPAGMVPPTLRDVRIEPKTQTPRPRTTPRPRPPSPRPRTRRSRSSQPRPRKNSRPTSSRPSPKSPRRRRRADPKERIATTDSTNNTDRNSRSSRLLSVIFV